MLVESRLEANIVGVLKEIGANRYDKPPKRGARISLNNITLSDIVNLSTATGAHIEKVDFRYDKEAGETIVTGFKIAQPAAAARVLYDMLLAAQVRLQEDDINTPSAPKVEMRGQHNLLNGS